MKFVLSRTSTHAKEIRDIKVDNNKVDNKKYKVTEGQVYFRYVRKYIDRLFIEINSLEELMEFQKDYGTIIIMNNIYDGEVKEIEIYDEYRE